MADGVLSGKRLSVIGGGKMGEAVVRAAVSANLLMPTAITVSDPFAERRDVFTALGTAVGTDNVAAVKASDIVMLAVKPQQMGDVLSGLAEAISTEQLVVSIAAGITTARIEGALQSGVRVVRVMPNTPMQVGRGAAALAKGRHATDADMEAVKEIFASAGIAVVVEEKDIDAVTAVSGSGPAYVFFLAECMIEAGVSEGLTPEAARSLVALTIEGAGKYLAESDLDAAELRKRVTSPGGTTQAALEVMAEGGVRKTLVAAVKRAAARSRELSGM